MFAMVIVAPAVVDGLFSFAACALEVAFSVVLYVLLDPPHAVTITAIMPMTAKNMLIFFIVFPYVSPSRNTIFGPGRFSRVGIPRT